MALPDFSSGPVAILGTGREARAAWRYLRARFAALELTLIDETPPDAALSESLGPRDRLEVTPLADAALERFGVLVRSPGFSLYREPLQRAMAAGVTVTTPSNLWFAAHPDARTVCITGTKGKSTTSALLAHLLSCAGLRVRLAGNIGKPLLDCDDEGVDWWVIELSSYQLADLQAEPGIAVLLNLSPEHLDWHGSESVYRRDKLRLVELAGDRPIVGNAADSVLSQALAAKTNVHWFNDAAGYHVAQGCVYDGAERLDVRAPTGLPGAHNLANVAAALTVARLIGVAPDVALASVASFRPLPHRLQRLGEQGGVQFVNDSISSTPVATAAALQSFPAQAITLIVGGLDRGVDWGPYMQTFARLTPRVVIGIPDSGPQILSVLRGAGICPAAGLHQAEDLASAVALARQVTPPGGVVLLSPGAPSFPRFRDYRDRGRLFAELCGLGFEDRDPF